MQATRINPGEGHENGTVESSHGHIKNRVEQSLTVRGSNDFETVEDYQLFIHNVTKKHNQRNAKNVEIERAALKPLPASKAIDYTEVVATVSSSSVIDVRMITYTVPSRLIGERLHVRIYHDKLECYLGSTLTITLVRGHKSANRRRGRSINYHHIISSLVKKPGAFRWCKFRDDILPNANYRAIWEHVDSAMDKKESSKFIVGLLHLASTQNCEEELAEVVLRLIANEQPIKLSELQDIFNARKTIAPNIVISQHSLARYNDLIPGLQEVFS
jgi:hypothetical protein